MTKPNMVPIESLLRHDDFIRGLARNLLGRDSRAEDVAQDAWLAAARDGPSSEAQARGWFGRVVRNKVASLRRKDASAARYRDRAPTPAGVPEPAELLDREAMRSHVVAALLALDPIYRDCLVLRFYEGLKPREIAARLDLPVETVRTRTRRGLERMRAELDERCGPRRRWLAALLPLAGRWPAPGWGRWLPIAAAAAVVALGVGGVAWLASDSDAEAEGSTATSVEVSAPVLAARGTKREALPEPASTPDTPALPPWRIGGRLTWGDDDTPAANVPVEVRLISGRKMIANLGTSHSREDGTFDHSLIDLRELSPATWSAASLHVNTPGYHSGGWPTGTAIPLRRLKAGVATQVLPLEISVARREQSKGHLMGVLRGVDGKRLINANIAAWRGEPGALTLVKRGFVNAIGEFGVPVGSSIYYSGGKGITEPEVLTIIAEAPGVGRVVRAGIHAHPTKDQWLGDLQLEPLPETTRITFELADGTPLAGMEVMAVPGSWASLIARDRRHAPFVHGDDTATWQTDESGSVTLAAASREPWSVWLVRPSGQENRKPPPPDLEVTPGDEDVRAVIRGHLMHIHVLDEAGDVAAGAQWEASGWPADRRDAAERVWKKVTTRHVTLPYPDDGDEPAWSLDDDASLEGGPAAGAMDKILLLGEPGSEWIVCAWTSGLHRGMARVTIPRDASRSTAEIQLARVAPGSLRIVTEENGEPAEAKFRFFVSLDGSTDVYGYGELHNGYAFERLIPGTYDLRLKSGTHHAARRFYSAEVLPGKTTTLTIKVQSGGSLLLDIDAPVDFVEKHARSAHLEVWSLETKQRLPRTRFLIVQAKDGSGATASFRGQEPRRRIPMPLPEGRYRIRVVTDDWASEPVEVEIVRGADASVRVRMEPAPK